MVHYPHSFTTTLSHVPATVHYAIADSFEANIKLSLPDAAYEYCISDWRDAGFVELARLFHSDDTQLDAAKFGAVTTAADGSVVLSMDEQQRRNVVEQAVKDVMSCMKLITCMPPGHLGHSALTYAASYLHRQLPVGTYEQFIQLHACRFIYNAEYDYDHVDIIVAIRSGQVYQVPRVRHAK